MGGGERRRGLASAQGRASLERTFLRGTATNMSPFSLSKPGTQPEQQRGYRQTPPRGGDTGRLKRCRLCDSAAFVLQAPARWFHHLVPTVCAGWRGDQEAGGALWDHDARRCC